jgi:hypothetical protein
MEKFCLSLKLYYIFSYFTDNNVLLLMLYGGMFMIQIDDAGSGSFIGGTPV